MEQTLFTDSSTVSSNRTLYTPSLFAKNSLMHLQEIGTLKALRQHTSRREGLDSFLFFIVLEGEGKLVYQGKEYNLDKGACVFLDCHQFYAHTTGAKLWSLRWCHFYGPTLPLIYMKYVERGGKPVFHVDEVGAFLEILEEVERMARSSDYIRDMKINEALNSLLTLLMAESWHPSEAIVTTRKTSLLPIKEYLDSHYQERISLEELAASFYINKYYLTRIFKEQFGVSIFSYLQNIRITHAKHLLRFSNQSIEEIGLSCGLGSAQYFSRVFKEVEGVSPSIYRNQW